MRAIRLLAGLCIGFVGVIIALGTLFLIWGWSMDADKELSFLLLLSIGFVIAYVLIRAARWCFKPRPKDEPAQAATAVPIACPPLTVPAPAPVPETVEAMGDIGKALFALNNADIPFQIVVGDGKEADLIAEWKLVDAKWRDMLMGAGVRKVFRIFMKLDHAAREVRTVDLEYDLAWNAGCPVLGARKEWRANASAEVFRGRKYEKEYQVAFKGEDVLASLLGLLRGKWVPPKPIYEYKFNTSEMKTPIADATKGCGWNVREIAFGDL